MSISWPNTHRHHRVVELPEGEFEFWLEVKGTDVWHYHSHRHGTGSGSGNGRWKRCVVPECLGEAVLETNLCFAHGEPVDIERRLKRIQHFSMNGVLFDQSTIERLRSLIMQREEVSPSLTFIGAEFAHGLRTQGKRFLSNISFAGARFHQPLEFLGCEFRESLDLRMVSFETSTIYVSRSEVRGRIDFSLAHSSMQSLGASDCKVARGIQADGIHCGLNVENSDVRGGFSCAGSNATVVVLRGSEVAGKVTFDRSSIGSIHADAARFPNADALGAFTVHGVVDLARSYFGARVQARLQADTISLVGAQLQKGGALELNDAKLDLTGFSTSGALRLAGNESSLPVVTTVRDADLSNVSLSNVDLSICMLHQAHNLASVSLDSSVRFAKAAWWFNRRRFAADELAWRLKRGRPYSWGWQIAGLTSGHTPASSASAGKIILPALSAAQVAEVYRDLRSGLESKSNEPGAADFYYGEMEMRRHSLSKLTDKVVVWLYWLFGGYGLRVLRPIVWLAVLIVFGGLAMQSFGFPSVTGSSADDPNGFVFAARAIVPGLRNSVSTTSSGQLVEVALAVLGPALGALAIIAFRSRVRR